MAGNPNGLGRMADGDAIQVERGVGNCQAADQLERDFTSLARGRGLDVGWKMWYNLILILSASIAILHAGKIIEGTSA